MTRRRLRLLGVAAVVALAWAWLADPAAAQSLTLDFGDGGQFTGRLLQLVALLTVLSLAPSILVMVTSFTRIVVVLSLLRSALGVQQTPPNSVIISLSLFLTAFVMLPTMQQAYKDGIAPLINEDIGEMEAFERTMAPFHAFMIHQVREKDLTLFIGLSGVEPPETPEAVPLQALIPAFLISELTRAFEIGFLIFVPFVVIDMVIASVLMSMGMMMLPPIMVALPFKLIFFVLVDGWSLLTGSLVQSFVT